MFECAAYMGNCIYQKNLKVGWLAHQTTDTLVNHIYFFGLTPIAHVHKKVQLLLGDYSSLGHRPQRLSLELLSIIGQRPQLSIPVKLAQDLGL